MLLFFALLLQSALSQSQYYVSGLSGMDSPGCGLSSTQACKSLGYTIAQNPPNSLESITYFLATGFYTGAANTNLSWIPSLVNPSISIIGDPGLTSEVDFGEAPGLTWSFLDYPGSVSLINLTLQNMKGIGIIFSYTNGTLATQFNVVNCVFQKNQFTILPNATPPYGSALNIHTTLATTNIVETLFINNQGDPAIESYGPLVITAGNLLISQSQFSSNTANYGAFVAQCTLANGCANFLLSITNTTFSTNIGNNTAAFSVSGYSVVLGGNSNIIVNNATVDVVRITANSAGTTNIAQTNFLNNTCNHTLYLTTLGNINTYSTTLAAGTIIQYNNNPYNGGLGVGVFCMKSLLNATAATISNNSNSQGAAGGAVDYFGFECKNDSPTSGPTTSPTVAPTPAGGPNPAAIVVPLVVIALLIGVGILVYFKWDYIKSFIGRNEYTRINEGTSRY